MKKEIHPKYDEVKFVCACGAKFTAGSTIGKDFQTEICSNCHPFYTGKQKLIDSSGRVDQFVAKMKKAQSIADKKVKKVDEEDAEEVAEQTAEEEVAEVAEVAEEPAKEDVAEKPAEVAEEPAKEDSK